MSRRRRPPEEAKQEILQAAEQLLTEGGVAAVTVRTVAARVGMTDAGVNHHFGQRQQLLQALLRHGGRRLRAAVEAALGAWLHDDADVDALIEALGEVYQSGYAELGVSLHAAGWRDRGEGLLDPVVQALHARRRARDTSIDDTRLAVAALHQALAMEPLYGSAFRRSAGISGRAAGDHKATYRWWAQFLKSSLGIGGST